jgi:glycerol-3-phosphate acyltransferase PlsX
MGSDTCPAPDVEGSIQAARDFGETIVLVGDRAAIERELNKYDRTGLAIEVIHAPQAIDMHDKPSQVSKTKKDSSMMIGMNMVRDGQADAFVTAGNTGAALALATLTTLRRLPGVKRPPLGSLISINGKTIILLDLGANADARPDWLVQFAIMGSIYSECVVGTTRPRVAILSNGEEEGKGNELVKETAVLLSQSHLNFIGNVEPKDMLAATADVIVADGFVGNIAIKSMEALAETMLDLMRDEINKGLLTKIGGALVRPALRRVYKQLDPFEIGGAPLLGVNGVVIIGHGRSNAKAIKNAIRQARAAVNGKLIDAIRAGMAQYVDTEAV